MPKSMELVIEQEDEEVHEVESIIDEKVSSGVIKYRVRWKGYGPDDDSWEPESNLDGCEKLLAAWKSKLASRKAAQKPKVSCRKTMKPTAKRHHDSMDIDEHTPESASSSSDIASRPAKSQRKTRPTNSRPIPGTAAYVRFRENQQTPDPDAPQHPDRVTFMKKLEKIPGPPINLYNDIDTDPSPPVSFEFIERYKFTEGVVDFAKENAEFWAGCSCAGGKCRQDCSCATDSGGRLQYDRNGRIAARYTGENTIALNECNERCGCSMDCPNRVVQRGRTIPLEIFKTELKGWGLRCPQKIPKGTFIDTYPGELLTVPEAERRVEIYNQSGLSYLFDLDKYSKVQLDEDDQWAELREPEVELVDPKDIYVVDGHNFGGVTRFINHSCDANLLIYAVTRERADFRQYDLAMFACKDIPAYEELTFSYGGKSSDGPHVDDDLDPSQPRPWSCYCGADNCVKYLWR